MTIKGYLLSFPERVARSVLGLGAGVAREVGEVAIPEGIRRGQLYQNLVDTTLRYLIERVGGVEGVYDTEDPLPEHFLARRTAGNAVEVLGFVAFRASPVWVLAALADLSGMGRHLIPEIADALKEQGLLEKDTEFTSMDQMLDGLERTSSRLAATMNTPPLDVAELRQEWKAIREEARGLKPLPSRDRIRHLWALLKTESERQGRSVFETSSLMAVSAARSLPDGVRWLGASTRVGAARTGQVLAAALLDHYKQTLSELGQVGYLAYARRQLKPYVHAAARQFSPKRRTLTQRLLEKSRRSPLVLALLLYGLGQAEAQPPRTFTRADTLRGSFTTPARAWWDVAFYDLHVDIRPDDSSIRGHNAITYRVLASPNPPEMQIDLMTPLEIDSVMQGGRSLPFRREGNAYFVSLAEPQESGELETITVHYHGQPHPARMPPWEGGFTWTADSLDRPWIVTTDQGMGASVWWPNKDTQADEPDSQRVALTLPDPIVDVSNGRLRGTIRNPDGTTTYEWFVVNPINNYAITVAAGSYAHFSDTFAGEKGTLTLDYWPLDYHLDAARRQFAQVEPMLQCFEGWFGPFPWYEDGYKLVETPHPGMEHQSAVAYGNHYANGYRGRDPSGTGIGMKFDFIIVHETAHEWFGNNISTKDLADMWVHESFANYAENLHVECLLGTEAGADYVIGTRRGIDNDRPIIPPYGVNAQGSGDMYPKGGNMLHTIRHIVGDDEKWRSILRGLNSTFWHQTVMGAEIEEYISQHAGRDLTKVFDQYLRTTQIPVLEYRIEGSTLSYRWADVVPGFDMPVEVTLSDDELSVIYPTESWQTAELELANPKEFAVNRNYYVVAKKVTDS